MTVVLIVVCLCLIWQGHLWLTLGLIVAAGLGVLTHGVVTADLHEEWDDELQADRARRGVR